MKAFKITILVLFLLALPWIAYVMSGWLGVKILGGVVVGAAALFGLLSLLPDDPSASSQDDFWLGYIIGRWRD